MLYIVHWFGFVKLCGSIWFRKKNNQLGTNQTIDEGLKLTTIDEEEG